MFQSIKKMTVTLLLCLALFAAVGFFALPPVIKNVLQDYVNEGPGRELRIERVTINPFTVRVDFLNINYTDHSHSSVLNIPRISTSISIINLFRQTIVIDNIRIERPQLHLGYTRPSDIALTQLITNALDHEVLSGDMPGLLIDTVTIVDGGIELVERTISEEVTTGFEQIIFHGSNLITNNGEDSPYTLSFNGPEGGRYLFNGFINIADLSSNGRLRVDNLKPAGLPGWISPFQQMDEHFDQASFNGDYVLSVAGKMFRLELTGFDADINTISMNPDAESTLHLQDVGMGFNALLTIGEGRPDLVLTDVSLQAGDLQFNDSIENNNLEQIRLSEGSLVWQNKAFNAGMLTVSGGDMTVRRTGQGRFILPSGMEAVARAVTERVSAAEDWQFHVDELNANNLNLIVIDSLDGITVEQELNDISLKILNLGTNPVQRAEFGASMSINRSGQFRGHGWFEIGNQAAQIDVRLDGLDLQPFNQYLKKITPLVLHSARLSSEFQVLFEEGRMSIGGAVETADITILDADDGKQALTLDRITASGVTFTTSPVNVSVKNVTADHLSITAEAYADGGLNLAGWFDAAAAFPDARDLTVSINQLELGGGMIDLTDFTLSPVLHMNVNQLTGSVSGLQFECMSLRSAGEPVARDTRPGMHTSRQPDETCRLNPRHPVSFRLQGNIDDSGTGELAGRIQQGFPGLQSEVRVKLKDMNFGMLSPYSASYLGRQIVAGTFDSDLVYFIRNGRFVGRHHVRFSNAALGEKVPTLRARVLPLDLAVALLQDSDDRIYLSMPFSGKLDEEKGMEVRTAAITAITDVLVDIVDEPFNTLGELVGIEGNTLKYVPFGPGSAAVTPDVLDTLIAVSEGLKQRPLLGLGIAGRYDPEVDRDALALQQIRLHVSLAANTGPPGETLDFSDPGIQEVLDEFAQARLGAGAGQPGADTEGHYKNIFMALVREEDVAASALESLARYRRQSIVDQLTRLGISEDRLISIDPAGGYSSDRSHARAELGLMSYQQ